MARLRRTSAEPRRGHSRSEHDARRVESKLGTMKLVGAGFRLAHGSPGIDRPPPMLGEHTDQVLAEAGYAADDIARLREGGIV